MRSKSKERRNLEWMNEEEKSLDEEKCESMQSVLKPSRTLPRGAS